MRGNYEKSLKSNEWNTHSSLEKGYDVDVRSSKTTSMDGKCKQVIILPYSAFHLLRFDSKIFGESCRELVKIFELFRLFPIKTP